MIVLPVGMHRTGSSMMANVLQVLGVQMNGFDDKHCEDRDFVRLNRAILRSADGAWNAPPSPSALREHRQWADQRIENLMSAKERLRALEGTHMWGWKDPRMCLLLKPLYGKALSRRTDVRYIWMQRSREHVCASLWARDGKHERGCPNYGTLYERYTRDLRAYLEAQPADKVYRVPYTQWTHWSSDYRLSVIKETCDFLKIGYNKAHEARNVIRPQR